MKYYFKSDYFNLVHPDIGPKQYGEYTKDELEESKKNTAKFHINQGLLKDAIYESGDIIPPNQKGTIIVFPEIAEESKDRMEEFIKKVFGETEASLAEEYDEPSDPTMFWEYGCDGMHFNGTAANPITGDRFGSNSPTIYIAGCRDETADYLIETAIDNMYSIDSPYVRKRKRKNGCDRCDDDGSADRRKTTVGFHQFKSFLVYHVGSDRFYQFATHDNHVYHKPEHPKMRFDAKVYDMVLPHYRNPF